MSSVCAVTCVAVPRGTAPAANPAPRASGRTRRAQWQSADARDRAEPSSSSRARTRSSDYGHTYVGLGGPSAEPRGEQPRAPLTTERRACGFTTVSRSIFPPRAAPPCHVRVSSPLPRPSTLGLAPSWSSLRRQAALSLTRSSPCWSSTRPTHRRRTVCPAADGTPVGETRPVWLASAVRAAAALAEAGRSSGQPGARPGAD